MSSALARQLGAIAAQNHGESGMHVDRTSLLFDRLTAADAAMDAIHNIACNGLAELALHDPRFKAYSKTLFAPSTIVPFQRQTKESFPMISFSYFLFLFFFFISTFHFLFFYYY